MMVMSLYLFFYDTVFYTQEIQLMLNGDDDSEMMRNSTEFWNLELSETFLFHKYLLST